MLKLLICLLFTFFLLFNKKYFWLVQNMLFLLSSGFMWLFAMNFFYSNMSYDFGIDFIAYGLILLSLWICSLMIMASQKIYKYNNETKFFIFFILVLLMALLMTFSVTNMFMFYFFFESSLVPTFFLILGWGYQPERLQASIYLLFYTLFASLPLLIGIFYYYSIYGSLFFYFFMNSFFYLFMYICLILAFLVKMPMFFVHLWLPSAHVEAPVSGSMILAGVLLKLGGYGLLRVMSLIQELSVKFNLIWYSISLIGCFNISVVCLFQVDMKSLIAYSSVAHMGLVISGLMTLNYWGFIGSYVLMIGHGLCSSALFCLSNIIYERVGSRSMFINKGLMNFMPSMAMWWFLLSSSNMAAPPSLNLLGEIMLINSIISWSWYSMFMLSMISFFSAGYSLYLFAYSQHGLFYSLKKSFSMNFYREYLLLFLHWVPLNMLILKVDYFSLWI